MSAPLAVVTGAGAGIGAAISKELTVRGYVVVPTDIDGESAESTRAICSGPASYRLDVTDPAAVEETVAEIVAVHAVPQVWVSNAGVSRMKRFLDITPDDFDRTIGVNLKGLFLTSQAAARAMVQGGVPGSIINIASMAAKAGRVPFLSDYVASKFGVVGLTEAMAFELAEYGIRVNSVCPGFVATAMQDRELAWEAELSSTTIDAVRKSYLAATPLGRLETPEDVARVVAFLASSDAEFITGEAIAVNGGAYMD